jgi:hypothetical protein
MQTGRTGRNGVDRRLATETDAARLRAADHPGAPRDDPGVMENGRDGLNDLNGVNGHRCRADPSRSPLPRHHQWKCGSCLISVVCRQ